MDYTMLLVHPNARQNLNLYRIRCLSQILSLLLDEFEWSPWLSSVFFRIPSKVCHYWSYILSTPTLSAFFYDYSNNHFTGFSKRSKSVWVQWLAIHPEIDFDMPIRETDGNSSAGLWLANHIICVIPTCIILQLNWLGYLCNPTPNAPFMVSFIYQSKLLLFTFGWSVTVIYSLLRIVK